MSPIIAGDPAPTNPQAEAAVRSLINGGYTERIAREIIAHVAGEAQNEGHQRGRARALAEAIKAASAEYQPQDITAPRTPYNEGVSDAVSALYRLAKGGESRG